MFQERYRSAYDIICPDEDSLDRIFEKMEGRRRSVRIFKVLRPVVVTLLASFLCLELVLPVAAKNISGVYLVLEKYAPSLLEFILQEEVSSTSKGITLQVEAVDIVDNTAEVMISFRDAEDSTEDRIRGRVDLYDSYHIRNLGENWQAGGCSFLEYDAAEDKAYFKISLSSSKDFSKSLVSFGVTQLLTEYTREERVIGLDNLITDPKEKSVSLNGLGRPNDGSVFPFLEGIPTADEPLFSGRVMDIVALNESMMDRLLITGVAYDEGVLRVQSCRGTSSDADRHVRVYLKDADGNEYPHEKTMSVGWQEEINGERVLFDEQWFSISEEELENYELYGTFYISGGSVKGNWDVTFGLE